MVAIFNRGVRRPKEHRPPPVDLYVPQVDVVMKGLVEQRSQTVGRAHWRLKK
jgi:hypothetical protein